MVRITWHGHACFRLEWPGVSVLTDPFDETVGYPLPQVPVDIVTISHEHYDHNYTAGLPGQPLLLRGQGANSPPVAKAAGLEITGLPSYHDQVQGGKRGPNTIFRFDHPELRIAHLGDLGHLPTPELVAELSGLDLLLVPVGGTYTIDGAEAAQLVRDLRPRLVIPMHFQTDALKFELAEVTSFTQHFDLVSFSSKSEVSLSSAELGSELKILVLNYLSQA